MSAIRPDIPATLPQTGANHPNTAVRAAQTAFFRAALGQASPQVTSAQTTGAPSPAVSAQASARTTAPQPAQTTALRTVATPSRLTDGEAPSRNLRPGSLLDIRI